MKEEEIKTTLRDIKEMMEKSSRFTAISGWSIAVIGVLAMVCYFCVSSIYMKSINTPQAIRTAIIFAICLLVVSFSIVTLCSIRKAKRINRPFKLDKTIGQLLFNFSLPMLVGGLFSIAMIIQGHYGLTSSIMLLFYGLALVNCHHYTAPVLRFLGYGELLLGIIDCFLVDYGFLFWLLGFGILHILFGIFFIIKYER